MRCAKCNSMINGNWSFCPSCGAKAPPREKIMDFFNIGLGDIFDKFATQGIDEMFRSFNELDADPENWHQPRSRRSGISVKILQSPNRPPQISVERFGDAGQINVPRIEKAGGSNADAPRLREEVPPRNIIEPKIEITRLPQRIAIEAELPGVRTPEDVQLAVLNESVEIRADAGDSVYFKVVPIPPAMRVIGKTFFSGRLRVELGR